MSEFQGCNDCFPINSAKSFVDCELMFNFADEPSVHAVGGWGKTYWKRAFTNVILRSSNLANLTTTSRDTATEASTSGVYCPPLGGTYGVNSMERWCVSISVYGEGAAAPSPSLFVIFEVLEDIRYLQFWERRKSWQEKLGVTGWVRACYLEKWPLRFWYFLSLVPLRGNIARRMLWNSYGSSMRITSEESVA